MGVGLERRRGSRREARAGGNGAGEQEKENEAGEQEKENEAGEQNEV